LAGVRVIVQAGWSDINAEQFLIIAKEAEKQAKLALLVDEDEDEDEDNSNLDKDIEDRNITKSTSKNDMKNDMNSRNSGGNLSQKRGVKVSHWNAERDSLLIGSCPHSWLFDRVGAVVHHGGAGSDSVVVWCIWCMWCVWDEKCLWSVVLCCVAQHGIALRRKMSYFVISPSIMLHISLVSFTVYPVHPLRTGTTASGLRAGKPTWICPFFGDQFFWGEMIKKGGLGPSPCSIRQLTLHIVAESLLALQDVTVSSSE
jgi:hypothetical protein